MRRRRRSGRRPLLVTVAVAATAVVVLGAYFATSAQSGLDKYVGQPVPQTMASSLSSAANGPYGTADDSMNALLKKAQGAPLTKDGKPAVLYIGAEYCPYCAAERWSLILALMRFGNFSDLHFMASSPNDVFPNTPTFTFLKSSYLSKYVSFEVYETPGCTEGPLEPLPSNYSSIFYAYGGGIPFTDIAGRYVMPGSGVPPIRLSGMDWNQTVSKIQSNQGVGAEIRQEANSLTAAICKATGNSPSRVCGDPAISGLTAVLGPLQPSEPSATLIVGRPSASASAWAIVQYAQIAPSTKTSRDIR